MPTTSRDLEAKSADPKLREVRYRHSVSFVDVLRELGATLLVSTYQAGKLGVISATDRGLRFSFLNFDQAMGVAVSRDRLAVGARGQIWFLDANHQIAPTLEPAGQYDACYLARTAHVTGGIHCHEMAWGNDEELWVVNTLFSCLATLDSGHSFVPRWRPPFITELAGQDRCHLNGLAMDSGQPRFVTVMAESNEPAGWRPNKSTTGCVLDVATGRAVTRGLAMPHSPRWHDDRLWVLNSGCGTLELVDFESGQRDVIATMPGYARGLAFSGRLAFVGLSRIRETAVFGGVPIAERRDELKCGVGVIDLRSGQTVATLEFESGVEEIFDVQLLSNTRAAYLCGPRPDQDDAQDIWVVPRADQLERLLANRRQGIAPSTERNLPSDATVRRWVDEARALQRERCMVESLELYQRAVEARPFNAEYWNDFGNALQDAGRQLQALDCYRRGAIADPNYGPALQNLGYVLVAQGLTEEGIVYLQQAQRVQPSHVNSVLIATALPVIYASPEDLSSWHTRLADGVRKLAETGATIDTTNTLVPTTFFAAYQGENLRDLNANLGRIYRGVELFSRREAGGSRTRRRIGFISAYFRDHTIGRLNLGRVRHLPRSEFEVILLSVGNHDDEMARKFVEAADNFVLLPRDLAAARRQIAEQELDVLVFTDVGMDALTYTLAFSRMAPIQCATWGHPVTTGSPAIDYFISSDLLETDEATHHYTETLVRRPTLGTYYFRPEIGDSIKTRLDFGLGEDRHLYICPQTLFKLHPEFDTLIAEVLRRDERGEIILIEGRFPKWTQLIRERFKREMPDVANRVRFIAAVQNQDFLQLLRLADVALDPIHFGGGNSSYEALAMGLPIVTLPGKYLRSRITQALYQKMGFTDFIAQSTDEFCDLAVCLASDRDFHTNGVRRIQELSAGLFEDMREVKDLADFFATVK